MQRSDERSFSIELRCVNAQGKDIWAALHCSHFDDPGQTGTCLIYQLHDISSRRLAESRLHHIAFHDGLTDLANRHCFHERLSVSVERSRLDASVQFAVMLLDLDRFKVVNDSLGHLAGNRLLREVATRLSACVRPSELVARLGGDEFAVLLENVAGSEAGLALSNRMLKALAQPVDINGTEVIPGASIGITFSDMGYRTVDEVVRDADLAMYEAKAAGRGRVCLFDSSMHERIADKLALEADLRRAIGAGQLTVMFQPLFNISWRDLAQPGFVQNVKDLLARHGVAPEQLTLEITETTLMGELEVSLRALHDLRAYGVRFSIDDFGTGYSSLSYLSTLPIDSLEIDRSFVMHMQSQPQNIEIVRAVMNLGMSLGKRVVAEGIETSEQLEMLRGLGVHVGQGYLLARPLRADQVAQAVAESTALAAA